MELSWIKYRVAGSGGISLTKFSLLDDLIMGSAGVRILLEVSKERGSLLRQRTDIPHWSDLLSAGLRLPPGTWKPWA